MYYYRWPDKSYRFICPPPSAKRTSSEVKDFKEAQKQGRASVDQDQEDQKGVMYHEYDLMFHYLLASLRRADGADSVTSTGQKTFNIFAGLGEHR